ncbi:unnamed protein product [Ixodes pacificus]
MKIPASTALAVVAVFLPIVTCAAEEEDDRSCEKRDKEAKEMGETVVKSCNYWCLPNKDDRNYYVNKYYPDGTKCEYGGGLQSLCINQACHHPESDTYKKYVSKNSGGNDVPPVKSSGETPEAPTGEEEPPETPDNTDEGPEQGDEQEEKEEDEGEAARRRKRKMRTKRARRRKRRKGKWRRKGGKRRKRTKTTKKNEGEEGEEEDEEEEDKEDEHQEER